LIQSKANAMNPITASSPSPTTPIMVMRPSCVPAMIARPAAVPLLSALARMTVTVGPGTMARMKQAVK
jgi:hypothetical protein